MSWMSLPCALQVIESQTGLGFQVLVAQEEVVAVAVVVVVAVAMAVKAAHPTTHLPAAEVAAVRVAVAGEAAGIHRHLILAHQTTHPRAVLVAVGLTAGEDSQSPHL